MPGSMQSELPMRGADGFSEALFSTVKLEDFLSANGCRERYLAATADPFAFQLHRSCLTVRT